MPGDSWETTTGLLDDFQLTAEEVWFGTSPEYMNGTRLLLNIRGPAVVEGEIVDPEYHLMLSCGDKWSAVSGGAAAEHTGGSPKFNRNSAVGRMIEQVKTLPEAIEVLKKRGESYEAATWQGLTFHWHRVKVSEFKDRASGELIEVIQPLPIAFIGEGAVKSAGTRKPRPERKPRGGDGTQPLRDAVKEFATKYDDHNDFVDAVLDEDTFDRAGEVEDSDEMYNEVLDPDSALWKESH